MAPTDARSLSVTCEDIEDKAVCNLVKHCKMKKKKCQTAFEPVDCRSLDKKKCKKNRKSGCTYIKKPKKEQRCEYKSFTDGCVDSDGEKSCQASKDAGFCDKDNELAFLFEIVCRKTCGVC